MLGSRLNTQNHPSKIGELSPRSAVQESTVKISSLLAKWRSDEDYHSKAFSNGGHHTTSYPPISQRFNFFS